MSLGIFEGIVLDTSEEISPGTSEGILLGISDSISLGTLRLKNLS